MFQIEFDNQPDAVVGIDLGTTNSLVARMNAGVPEVIGGIVPSIVSVTDAGEIIVGKEARAALISHPERTIYSVKRLMGRGIEDIRAELSRFPFAVDAEASESVVR